MKDIEQMKKKFEEELKLAEFENKYEERLKGSSMNLALIGNSFTQIGKIQTSLKGVKTSYEVGMALSVFPVTEDSKVYIGHNKYLNMSYKLDVHRYPNQSSTELNISWIHEDLDISLNYMIQESDPEVMQFFMRSWRELEESEFSSFGIQKNEWRDSKLPYLSFNCGEIVRFKGGRDRQKSVGHVNCIVETFKYKYEFGGNEI